MDAAQQSLAYRIALTQIDGVGGVSGRNLLAYLGSPEAVFKASGTQLVKVPGIGEKLARNIKGFDNWETVERELQFIRKNNVKAVFYTDADYPERFKHQNDTPLLFYFKGNGELNPKRTVGIVGTRKSTDYGKRMTEKLIEDLSFHQPVIVSGLAYGIDVVAHKAALANGLQTIGIQGCGLNRIYPAENTNVAEKMYAQGGVLSEFVSSAVIGPENFALRNRLV
ncbi:MAG TPA: DNA-processing protein DprA, partial [Chitinophagales bacterium]|nr:DNA-processing protein DprA [Chitinophagales bacterium]